MKKRVIALFTAAAAACTSTTAYAHTGDVFKGKYIGKTGVNIVFRAHISNYSNGAVNDVLTYEDVYKYASEWNGISSNVVVSGITAGGSTPSIPNEAYVFGADWSWEPKGLKMGYIFVFDINGNECEVNDDWYGVEIQMNKSSDAINYYKAYDKDKSHRKKVFVHEVGHALKLSHPLKSSAYSGHTIDGYPLSVMNQGSPSDKWVSSTVTSHDKSCLIAKWGK